MKTNNTQKTTFWKFLENDSIEIPIIQRDYAQGREGKEYIRKGFLSSLKEALDKKDSNKPLKLDFVYGTQENSKINPLDGQQRLTTLWLMHWYIALMSGNLDENTCERLKKFTYQTRISSRDFCEELCKSKNFQNYKELHISITDYITNQTWFSSAWKQDPTIKSMLVMLAGTNKKDKEDGDIKDGTEEVSNENKDIKDGIEKVFQDVQNEDMKKYWGALTGENCPIIFYYLHISDIGLTDDLYIKMNARGKQLSSFENLKADLLGYVQHKSEESGKDQDQWKKLMNPQNGLPVCIDTEWTDIFWKNKSKEQKDSNNQILEHSRIDEIFFTFLNRFFWNELFTRLKSGTEEDNKHYKFFNNSGVNSNDFDTTIAYRGLDDYKFDETQKDENGEIPISLFLSLKKVLYNYGKYLKSTGCKPIEFDKEFLTRPWDTEFHFIPQYKQEKIVDVSGNEILKVSHITQVQRVVFFAICKYFNEEKETEEANKQALKCWMRVVWNLVSGQDKEGDLQIRSTEVMHSVINFISNLQSHYVYASLYTLLYNQKIRNNTDFEKRCMEEAEKAEQILRKTGVIRFEDCKNWEQTIIDVENEMFFHGSIRFLYHNERGKIDWSEFNDKLKNVKSVINTSYDGLKELIGKCIKDDELRAIAYDIRNCTWLFNLLNDALYAPIHYLLTGTQSSSLLTNKYLWAQRDLIGSNLLKNMYYRQWHVDGCNLHDFGLLALFPYNAKSEQKKYVIANIRNKVLSGLFNIEIIKSNQKIQGCDFFWGWNVEFEFCDRKFQWTYDGEIYAVDENNNGQKPLYPGSIAMLDDYPILLLHSLLKLTL